LYQIMTTLALCAGRCYALPSAAHRCCARLATPPYWRDQLRYAVPSLARGNTLFFRDKNRIHTSAELY